MTSKLHAELATLIANAAEQVASDRHYAAPSGYTGPLAWEAGATAILTHPRIARALAALDLLEGNRRDEAALAAANAMYESAVSSRYAFKANRVLEAITARIDPGA